jgi:hypothetical protein
MISQERAKEMSDALLASLVTDAFKVVVLYYKGDVFAGSEKALKSVIEGKVICGSTWLRNEFYPLWKDGKKTKRELARILWERVNLWLEHERKMTKLSELRRKFKRAVRILEAEGAYYLGKVDTFDRPVQGPHFVSNDPNEVYAWAKREAPEYLRPEHEKL